MKILKLVWGVVLFGALILVVQLADLPKDSPAAKFQRLPDVGLRSMAEAEWAAGRTEAALLLLDYVIENDLPDKAAAATQRQLVFAKLAVDSTPANRIKATGWATALAGGNTFENLAGSTVADAVLYGDAGEIEGNADEFVSALNAVRPMAAVFPPADGAIKLAKAAHVAGALNESLTKYVSQFLRVMQADPKSALAVEQFKENFMPLVELAKRCRTWGEFETILQQADSPDQLKVLTKMASSVPAAARRLSQVLTVAGHEGRAAVSACLDHILRSGPKGLDALYAGIGKGAVGLKFVAEHPGFVPERARRAPNELQEQYQALRQQYGAVVPAVKYLAIAVLCGLLVLVVVPGRYLEKLIAKPGGHVAAPGAIHYFLSALTVGVVLSGLAYLLSLAVRPAVEPVASATATGEAGPVVGADSAFLSGTVVLISLAIHAVVWFFVRGKIRQVEDDEAAAPTLRLKRLENLEVFLDLPLFTGLALTVIAFILITLNAGMSRHFAYTSTVVGILSAVSLRIRYVFPLKERLIQMK